MSTIFTQNKKFVVALSLFLTHFFLLSPGKFLFAQTLFKSIKFTNSQFINTFPIVNLNNPETLTLSFDDLSTQPRDLKYTFVLCDKEWQPANLLASEYLEGIPEQPVNSYRYSFNTQISYINYQIKIPSQDLRPRRSGNWLIIVWEGSEKDKPLLVKRWLVVEESTQLTGAVRKSSLEGYPGSNQEVEITVRHPGFNLIDPLHEVTLRVIQNDDLFQEGVTVKPTYLADKELRFSDPRKMVFPGGDEFRHFNSTDLRSNGFGISDLQRQYGFYHLTIRNEEEASYTLYRGREDLNGGSLFKKEELFDKELTSEYVYVHFHLPIQHQGENRSVIIDGEITDWGRDPSAVMEWNAETSRYEAIVLVRQGNWDYRYRLCENNLRCADLHNFSQTENRYHSILYYRGISDRCDRIIGFITLQSGNR